MSIKDCIYARVERYKKRVNREKCVYIREREREINKERVNTKK